VRCFVFRFFCLFFLYLKIPSPAVMAHARPALEAFAALFPVLPVEAAKGKRKAHFWSDIAGPSGAANGDSVGGQQAASDSAGGSGGAGGQGGGAAKAAKGGAPLSVRFFRWG
jgi:hypothetical protein